MDKPILCLDFDGVCHLYTSGWQGADILPDPPVPGLWEFLLAASPEFEIAIFSTRSHQEGGKAAMVNWFGKHAPYDSSCSVSEAHITWYDVGVSLSFPDTKPPAHIGIDDRVLTFTGTWPEVEVLKAFKPWNKR